MTSKLFRCEVNSLTESRTAINQYLDLILTCTTLKLEKSEETHLLETPVRPEGRYETLLYATQRKNKKAKARIPTDQSRPCRYPRQSYGSSESEEIMTRRLKLKPWWYLSTPRCRDVRKDHFIQVLRHFKQWRRCTRSVCYTGYNNS